MLKRPLFNDRGPLREPSVVAKTLKPNAAQEHLLHQLGQALIIQWDTIPDALQYLLIDQSIVGADSGVERGAIERFIATARLTPIANAQMSAGMGALPQRFLV